MGRVDYPAAVDDDARLDRLATRDLTRRYALALGLVAVLSIAAQVVVQAALHRARTDATVVNLAGRQRMLSQRLCKAAMAWRDGDGVDRPRRLAEVGHVLAEWTEAQRQLSGGDDLPNAGRENSPLVRTAFTTIEAPFQAMARAATALPGDPASVDRLLEHEGRFLDGMERIVGLYSAEAESRVRRLITLELSLCGLLVLVLVGEGVVVFRPAVRRLHQAILDREQLRRHELERRELQVAADVARGIGQDLHDGLGQTLTALSFHAKTLERSLEGPAAEQARTLSGGITDAIAQARAHARRLAPVEIQAAGLETALRELADATTRAAGCACTLDWQAEAGVPAAAGGDLYRIVQEAVTNALRHGRARSIAIGVRRDGGLVELQVRNAGIVGPPAGDGVGLRSMRNRAARLGGSLEAGPVPDGWQVRMRLTVAEGDTGAQEVEKHDGTSSEP